MTAFTLVMAIIKNIHLEDVVAEEVLNYVWHSTERPIDAQVEVRIKRALNAWQ